MLCFMNLITDKAGTDLLRSKGETSRDVWMDLELTDCSGMILEVILLYIIQGSMAVKGRSGVVIREPCPQRPM